MGPAALAPFVAQEHRREQRAAARDHHRIREARSTPARGPAGWAQGAARKDVTVRPAAPRDRPALASLAQLDGHTPLAGNALVAEVEGRVRAALSLDDGSAIADPFLPSRPLVELLRFRAGQLARAERAADRPVRRRALASRRSPA